MKRVILGIDPGTVMMGYGIISTSTKTTNTLEFIEMDILNLSKELDPAKKLYQIFECTVNLIEKHRPECLAIEAPFFGKNVQSMLKLGRAQGVAIAAAMSKGLPVFEYAPRKIKMAITGKGTASKEQVANMLFRLMNIDEIMPKHFDATDGLAAAVCHALQHEIVPKTPQKSTKKTTKTAKSYSGWETFIRQNQERIKLMN